MAGEIASAYLSIYPKLEGRTVVSEIEKAMTGAGESAGSKLAKGISGGMTGAGKDGADKFSKGFSAVKVALGNIIADVAKSAASEFMSRFSDGIEQSDAMQKFGNTMKFAGFATEQIDSVRDAMKAYADQTVYDLGEVMDTTAKLAANGVKDFDLIVQAAGNLNAAAGGTSESFGYFANAITQVNGAGKLMTQDWNQIINALPGASGAIQRELEAMGAWDSSVGTFKDALSEGKISAEQFNTALKNLGMTDIAKEAATSTTTFEGAMGQYDAAFTNFTQGIYDAINGEGRITGFINNVASAFDTWGPTVAQAVTEIVDGLSGFANGVMPVFADAFDKVWPQLSLFASGTLNLIALGFTALGDAVSAILPIVVPFLAEFLSVALRIGADITYALAPLVPIFSEVFAALSTAITTHAIPAMQVILSVIQAVWPTIRSIIEVAVTVIASVVTVAFGTIQAIISVAMNFVRSIVAAASAAMQGNWTGALNIMRNAVSTAVAAIGNILRGLKQKCISALSGAATWLVNAGKSIIQGLVNGIKGAVGWVTSAVRSVCDNALGALKSFFKIGSPSRLMAQQGRYLMEGLAVGIDAGAGAAVSAMEDASLAVASALGTGTDDYGYGGGAAIGDLALIAEVQALRSDIASMRIVLDSGALVGGISRQMDGSLGRRQLYAGRGVI